MITKTSSTLTNLKNLFIEIFLDKTVKVSNVADGSVVNATAFGVAKVAQKAMKDIAIKEAQIFPESATGEYLDRAAALYGVSPRKNSLGSSTYIRVYATPGTVYDESITFVNKNGIRFSVDEPLTVDSSGYGYVKVRSVNAGYSTNVDPNSIVQVSPQPDGHIECTNEYYAVGGRDSEDDETFRIRIQNNLNILSKSTVEYWTQVFQNLDDRILKVMSAGLDEEGRYVIYLATQNGIWLTDDELDSLLQQAQGYFGLSELNMDGDAVGIVLKNIDWFYVGSERGMDFRVRLDPDYDVATVRKNIQVNLTKYLDWRFWEPGTIIEWDDLLDIVKKSEGVKYVPDEYFFPYYDQEVPFNQLPRIRGFVMRDESGNILYDAGSNLSSLFYPASNDDLFTGLNDSSLSLTHSVYFNVVDQNGNALEGARITIDINSILTDSNGQGVIALENGSYSYTVVLDKYNSVSGTFTVLNGAITIDVTMVLAPYTVTFNVVDEDGNRLSNVTIVTNNVSLTTNSNGQATISLQTGEYTYQATLLGYDTILDGVYEVEESDTTVFVRMYLSAWNVTLFVLDTRNQPVKSAIIQLGSSSYLTDEEGKVQTQLVNGDYKISISKVGYISSEETFTVRNMDQTYSFVVQSFEYNVTVKVIRQEGGTPLQNVSISVNDSSIRGITDEEGNFSFKAINGNYTLTAVYPYYDDASVSFNVENDDTEVEVQMVLKHYNNVFQIQNEDNQFVSGAQISINNSIYTTNEVGRVTIPLQNGTYPYTIRRAGYEDYTGTLNVYGADTNTAITMKYILYNVEFTVKGKDSALVSGALIVIDDTQITTNEEGVATINLPNGSYEYTVTADDYDLYSGQIIVSNANLQEEVQLQEKTYLVTIVVTNQNNGTAIQGATVTIGEKEETTNSSGIANFNLPNGTYNYVINRNGFAVSMGEFQVLNQNVTYPVQLTPIVFDVTFTVKDDTPSANPVEGVTIQIGDSYTLQTGSDGTAEQSIYAGDYTVIYSKEGYQTVTTDISVTGENSFEQVIKKIYNLSFNVVSVEREALSGVEINVTGAAVIGNTQTVTTGPDGTTPPIQVINGAYSYGAYLSGYSPEEGSGMIENADKVQNVDLVFGIETTFFAKSGSTPIEGVQITIDTTQIVQTASNGQITVNLSNGQHSYTYSKEGYVSGSGTIQVNDEEQTVNIDLIEGGKTSITITDNSGPVSDAHVTFEDEDGTKYEGDTDSNGTIDINLPDGNYTVTVEKDGYKDWTGETEMSGSDIDLPIDLTNNKYWSGQAFVGTFVLYDDPWSITSREDKNFLNNVTITATNRETQETTTVGTWENKSIEGWVDGTMPIFTFSQLTNGTWDLSIESTNDVWFNKDLTETCKEAWEYEGEDWDYNTIVINNGNLDLFDYFNTNEEFGYNRQGCMVFFPRFSNTTVTVKNPEGGNVQGASFVGSEGIYSTYSISIMQITGTTNTSGVATLSMAQNSMLPTSGIVGSGYSTQSGGAEGIELDYTVTPQSPYQPATGEMSITGNNQNTNITVVSTYQVTFNVTQDDDQDLVDGSTITCTPVGGGSSIEKEIPTTGGNVVFDLDANKNYNYVVSCGISRVTAFSGCFSEETGQTGTITGNKSISVTLKMFKKIYIAALGYGISSGNVSLSVTGGAEGSSNTLIVGIKDSGSATFANAWYFPQSTSSYTLTPTYPSSTVGTISNSSINVMTFDDTVTMRVYQTYTYSVTIRRVNSTNGLTSVKATLSSSSRSYNSTKTGTSLSFTNVPYGTDYRISVPAGTYWESYSASSISITSNSSRTINLTPLYSVTINTGQPSCSVTFTDSDSQKHTGTSNSSAQITFSKIPAGNYSVSVSKSGFTSNSTTGTISQSTSLTYSITCEVVQQPKLVQITTSQSNYQLDTSYTYLSMLVVGRGNINRTIAENPPGLSIGKLYQGGGSGTVSYSKNIPLNTLNLINCTFDETYGIYYAGCSKVSDNSNKLILFAYGNRQISVTMNGCEAISSSILDSNYQSYFVNSGSSGAGGGRWTNYTDNELGYGASSSRSGDKEFIGGDGTYGYEGEFISGSGGYSYYFREGEGHRTNNNLIPVESIFEGTGWTSGPATGGDAASAGGAGYSGYFGSGDTASFINSNPIICLYYHNDPL